MTEAKVCKSCGSPLQPSEDTRCAACTLARRQRTGQIAAAGLLAGIVALGKKGLTKILTFLPKLIMRLIRLAILRR